MELFVIAILIIFAGAQESQLEGLQNTLSVVGSTVTLKCLSPSRSCNGTDWQKYIHHASPSTIFKGPRTMLNNTETDRDRYSVDNSSGCDLIIRNVQLKDAGRYICSTIISSSQFAKTAYLIILETQPKCTLNISLDDTVEGDRVQMACVATYNGTDKASMYWKGVTDAPAAVKNGTAISRSHSIVASAPEVPSFTCVTSFALETVDHYNGDPVLGMATNRISNASCSTSAIRVFYSVRDVTLSPFLHNYPPGTVITCTANGNPSPNFKWQENENNGVWMDMQYKNGNKFTMSNISSKQYRCVAMNVVKSKSHNATSPEFQVNNTGATATPMNSGISFTLTVPIAIGGGVTIGVVLLLIIVILICFCVRCCPGYKCCHPGQKDGVAHHHDHEMSQQSAIMDRSIPSTGTQLVGQQEATYASLGEDRDANEYASLEERQKSKAREKVKVLDQETAYASLGEDRDVSEYASLEERQISKAREKVKVLDPESSYASLGEGRDEREYASLEQGQQTKPKKTLKS